jgi:hypothetical protein
VRAGEPNTVQVHGGMQDAPSDGMVGATNHHRKVDAVTIQVYAIYSLHPKKI